MKTPTLLIFVSMLLAGCFFEAGLHCVGGSFVVIATFSLIFAPFISEDEQ